MPFDETRGPFAGHSSYLERASSDLRERIEVEPSAKNRAEIFPRPLPGESDPVPARFDNTGQRTIPLSGQAEARLETLLAAVPKPRKPVPSEPIPDREPNSRLTAFRVWRDDVAMPLFSTFVARLRGDGHTARVVARTADSSARQCNTIEYVELRVQLHVSSAFSPSYRTSGHLRISVTEYAGWRMDVFPTAGSRGGSYGQPAITVEQMPKEQLETQVLAMLDRLHDQLKR